MNQTPATQQMVMLMREQRRRGVVMIVLTVTSFWHYFCHDDWWFSQTGAAAYVVLSVVIVVCCFLFGSRLWGFSLLSYQFLFNAGIYEGYVVTSRWDEGNLVAERVWDTEPDCYLDPVGRFESCPGEPRVPSCLGMRGYQVAMRWLGSTEIMLASRIWAPPSGSYLGPIPSSEEAFSAAAEHATPVELSKAGVEKVFSGATHKWTAQATGKCNSWWKWRGAKSLAVVVAGDAENPALLFSWNGGEAVDLYDAQCSPIATWTRPSYQRPSVRQYFLSNFSNALWLRRRWLHEPTTELEVQGLRLDLDGHGIRTIYPFVGPMKPGGRFGWRKENEIAEYDPEIAQQFFNRMRTEISGGPDLGFQTVLPWTGGVLGRDAFPEDPAWRADFVTQAKALVDLGADGIHVNIEPMPEATPGYLELLKELKQILGPNKIVSVAAYPPPTPQHPYPDVHWSPEFLVKVCGIVDDMSIMAYDTALKSPASYSDLVAHWFQQTAETPGGTCKWRMGIPSYEEDKPWHDPHAETLSAALDGILRYDPVAAFPRGPFDPPHPFRGLAIYSSWTTDSQEWAEFDIRWNRQAPVRVGQVDPEVLPETTSQ